LNARQSCGDRTYPNRYHVECDWSCAGEVKISLGPVYACDFIKNQLCAALLSESREVNLHFLF